MTAALDGASRVVVTGGAGFLGTRVSAQLLERGCNVVAIDTLTHNRQPSHDLEASDLFRLESIDIRDDASIRAVVRDARPQVVFHLAALHFIPACVRDPATALAVNVLGTQHILDACAALDEAPLLVLASTADVYAPADEAHSERSPIGPDNVYGLSKLTAEGLVKIAARQGRIRPLVVRLFNLYGPGETNPHVLPEIMEQLRRGDVLRLGNTSSKRDFVFVDDAADAVVRLAELRPSESVVNVGTGSAYSIDDAIARVRHLTGRDIRIEVDEERWRPSDRPSLRADNALLRGLLHDAVPTSFDDGLRRLLATEGLVDARAPR